MDDDESSFGFNTSSLGDHKDALIDSLNEGADLNSRDSTTGSLSASPQRRRQRSVVSSPAPFTTPSALANSVSVGGTLFTKKPAQSGLIASIAGGTKGLVGNVNQNAKTLMGGSSSQNPGGSILNNYQRQHILLLTRIKDDVGTIADIIKDLDGKPSKTGTLNLKEHKGTEGGDSGGFLQKLLEALGLAAVGLAAFLGNKLSGFVGLLTSLGTTISNAIKSIGDALGKSFDSAVTDAKKALEGFADSLKENTPKILEDILHGKQSTHGNPTGGKRKASPEDGNFGFDDEPGGKRPQIYQEQDEHGNWHDIPPNKSSSNKSSFGKSATFKKPISFTKPYYLSRAGNVLGGAFMGAALAPAGTSAYEALIDPQNRQEHEIDALIQARQAGGTTAMIQTAKGVGALIPKQLGGRIIRAASSRMAATTLGKLVGRAVGIAGIAAPEFEIPIQAGLSMGADMHQGYNDPAYAKDRDAGMRAHVWNDFSHIGERFKNMAKNYVNPSYDQNLGWDLAHDIHFESDQARRVEKMAFDKSHLKLPGMLEDLKKTKADYLKYDKGYDSQGNEKTPWNANNMGGGVMTKKGYFSPNDNSPDNAVGPITGIPNLNDILSLLKKATSTIGAVAGAVSNVQNVNINIAQATISKPDEVKALMKEQAKLLATVQRIDAKAKEQYSNLQSGGSNGTGLIFQPFPGGV